MILRAGICMVLGMCITIGAAWVFAYLEPSMNMYAGDSRSVKLEDGSIWTVGTQWRHGVSVIGFGKPQEPNPWNSEPHNVPISQVIPSWADLDARYGKAHMYDSSRTILAFGWPCLCAWYDFPDNWLTTSIIPGITPTRSPGSGCLEIGDHALPTRLIWSGLLIDMVLYALVCMGLHALLMAMVHYRRLIRGLCPMCRHTLAYGTTFRCSECGWHPKGLSGNE